MKQIPLTQGKVTLVDDGDYQALSVHAWFAVEIGATFYAYRNKPRPDKGLVAMHRVIADAPDGVLIDHWDGDGLNNQRSNLRQGTKVENGQNRRPNSGRSFKGARWVERRQHWVARITVQQRPIYLGHFDSEEAAARAYDHAALEYFGEFARPNFPLEDDHVSTRSSGRRVPRSSHESPADQSKPPRAPSDGV